MSSPAFALAAVPLLRPPHHRRCLSRRPRPALRLRASPRACDPSASPSSPSPLPAEPVPPAVSAESDAAPSLPSFSLPPDAAVGLQALLDDLAARPQYYLNVTGVALGLGLSAVVLSATMVALDSLPLVPDVLRVVGLAYLFWFLGKFLLNGGERGRLANEIDEFVQGIKGEGMSQGLVVESAREERALAGGDVEKAEVDLVV